MLVFDQLKKDDRQIRVVTMMVLGGLFLLGVGLWWVQVVSSRDYQQSLETQSIRTVRIPAVRGKILDRQGVVLAENRPTYSLNLYLEELRKPFDAAYKKAVSGRRAELNRQVAEQEKNLHRKLTRQERGRYSLLTEQLAQIRQQARYEIASNIVAQVAQRLQQPLWLNPTNFEKHCKRELVLPYPVVSNVDATNIARFEEHLTSPLGVDLEAQSTRVYPFQTLAAHVLGSLQRDDASTEGEEAFFSHRMPDYKGQAGIEGGYDKQLRGLAGAKSVVVNNIGFRQAENVWTPAEPGQNVVLTIDLRIQQAAERALQNAPLSGYAPVRGAVVVMDVTTGDLLAVASSPTLNPNSFIQGFIKQEWERLNELFAQKNRATYENYMPGSIFKTIVGLAALDAGWNPATEINVEPNPKDPAHGCYKFSPTHWVKDLVSPGKYDFKRALEKSSNTYFITAGLFAKPERIIKLAQHLHFGERCGLPTYQDSPGKLPTLADLHSHWTDAQTANISIGAAPVWVTPVQIAVLTSALANGGKVLWPRLVDRVESQDPTSLEPPVVFPKGQVRDELGVSPRSMAILHEAMLADTEEAEGTGHHVRDVDRPLAGMHIYGKTGTAVVQDVHNNVTGQTTWFASFAALGNDKPRWAIVVMVENGNSGGRTCSPVAGKVYAALQEAERQGAHKPATVATISR